MTAGTPPDLPAGGKATATKHGSPGHCNAPAPTPMSRRSALRTGLLGVIAPSAFLPLIGCSVNPSDSSTQSPAQSSTGRDATSAASSAPQSAAPTASTGSGTPRVLLAYFSRAGENYSYGGRTNLEVGNTQVAAQMITELIACDVHRIEAAQAYSTAYDATVARNVEEQDQDARPELAQPLPDVSPYDVVLLGSPIWNVRPPMIMNTVADSLDLTGKRLLPFVTFAVSGLGSTQRIYAEAFPGADVGEGLAVRGEEVTEARPEIEAWLAGSGLPTN